MAAVAAAFACLSEIKVETWIKVAVSISFFFAVAGMAYLYFSLFNFDWTLKLGVGLTVGTIGTILLQCCKILRVGLVLCLPHSCFGMGLFQWYIFVSWFFCARELDHIISEGTALDLWISLNHGIDIKSSVLFAMVQNLESLFQIMHVLMLVPFALLILTSTLDGIHQMNKLTNLKINHTRSLISASKKFSLRFFRLIRAWCFGSIFCGTLCSYAVCFAFEQMIKESPIDLMNNKPFPKDYPFLIAYLVFSFLIICVMGFEKRIKMWRPILIHRFFLETSGNQNTAVTNSFVLSSLPSSANQNLTSLVTVDQRIPVINNPNETPLPMGLPLNLGAFSM